VSAAVFRALGDETRLSILKSLDQKPVKVGAIGADLPISRQAVRKHLAVLEEAGLITLEPHRREVMVSVVPGRISDGIRSLQEIERLWESRLERLKDFVEKNP
jgi:DNA-binding transcriptional ArsR family regulator